jgi:hypothetical protein
MIDCGMCGHQFTRQEGAACSKGCPMATGCGMVTCPSCGHEFPPDSVIVSLVTRLLRKRPSIAKAPAVGMGAGPALGKAGVR